MKLSISRLNFNATMGVLRISLRATSLRKMDQHGNSDLGTWEDNFHQENSVLEREVPFPPGMFWGEGDTYA